MSRFTAAAAALILSTIATACGSNSSHRSSSVAAQEGVSFALCMRSHGVPNFPDPSATGGIDLGNIPGINTSSPAFVAARSACNRLLPTKRVPSVAPSAQAFARLLRWAGCMRAHGISGLPDPRPNPPPSPGSSVASHYGTLMGDGGYWVGIPVSVNAHSPAFMRLSTTCGESPSGHRG